MGIPRLFYWINSVYPECLIRLKKGEKLQVKINCYALDNNATIHPICQDLYGYGGGEKSFLHPKKKMPVTEKDVFFGVCKKNNELRRIVNPTDKFMNVIDGVAGIAKLCQQRQRRFISSKTRSKNLDFDSNKITTGSEFMNNLSKFIHFNIERQLLNNTEWRNLEVIFSNEKVPGEGEHKIIQYIKKNPSMSYCIDSPDADLLMLSLCLNSSVYIIRENIYRNIDCKYFVVDVTIFKSLIIRDFKWGSFDHKYTDTQLLYDFILICFMLGNDFLPHIPSLEISNDGLNVLMDVYPTVASKHGHLCYRNEKKELCLNTKSLHNLFFLLSQNESDRLLEKSNDKSIEFPDTLLNECICEMEGSNSTMKTTKELNFDKYRGLYYEKKLGGCDVKDICNEYFKGLLFVLRYYIDEIPDYQWFYPFHKSPLFVDMYKNIGDFNGEMKFEHRGPLSSFEQLLAVLPPESVDIIPPSLHHLMKDEDSPIRDFFPSDFVIDLDGKKKEWEGQAILPFLDIDRLRTVYKREESNLTENERKLNVVGKSSHYKNVDGNIKKWFDKN